MRQKLSITIEEEKIKILEKLLKDGFFRSKSHIIEFVLNKFLKERARQDVVLEKENGRNL